MDPNKPIADIMTREVVTVKPSASLSRVHDLFTIHTFHHIVVLDEGRVAGIISKTDYLRIQHMIGTTWSGVTVVQDLYCDVCARDIMSSDPITVDSGDTIGLAADIFQANRLHALPVVDEGTLVGIITSHDLLSYAYQEPL
jgi:CBS domain-containing protein